MIMNIRHTGIVVNDLPLAIYFYRDLLGLKIIKRTDEKNHFIKRVCGIDEAGLTTVKMAMRDGGIIELLYYRSHLSGRPSGEIYRPGLSHIAFTVKDLEVIYRTLSEAGIQFISAPLISSDRRTKVVFCRDFQGNFIELVEELKPEVKKIPGYIDTIYDEKVRPQTKYPFQLSEYLFHRFGMERGYRLLDVGCGRGDLVRAFGSLSLDVSGLDREKSQMHADIQVKYANIESEPFPFDDGIFDVVFSKSLIEHLFDPGNFMKECFRILKPGGRIILMTPDWSSQVKIFFDDYTHRQPYTMAAIKDILEIFGFREVTSEIFYQLPILWRYPALKVASHILQLCVPVTMKSQIKIIRWSIELMVLGTGIKDG